MSLETVTFTEELRKIDANHEELKHSEAKLRSFILSPAFLLDHTRFEQDLSDFQNKVVSLIETIQAPLPGLSPSLLSPPEEKAETLEKIEEKSFSFERAFVVAIAIITCGIVVERGLLPPITLAGIALLSAILMFLPQLKSLIAELTKPDESVEEESSLPSEEWITDQIAKIRSIYTSARFLIKVQTQTSESLPDYGLPGMDEALFNRHKYFMETLPADFLSRIGKIMIACDRAYWTRKSVIVAAIVQAKQTVPPPTRG